MPSCSSIPSSLKTGRARWIWLHGSKRPLRIVWMRGRQRELPLPGWHHLQRTRRLSHPARGNMRLSSHNKGRGGRTCFPATYINVHPSSQAHLPSVFTCAVLPLVDFIFTLRTLHLSPIPSSPFACTLLCVMVHIRGLSHTLSSDHLIAIPAPLLTRPNVFTPANPIHTTCNPPIRTCTALAHPTSSVCTFSTRYSYSYYHKHL